MLRFWVYGAAVLVMVAAFSTNSAVYAADDLPNILWLTTEDIGPELGCYGDTYADTPNLDALAAKGTLYLHAWSNAPVCAPARTCIISGMYAPTAGAQHMRSMTKLPEGMQFYPQILREAGYYCTNNSKEDYNLAKPGEVWDESSKKAHWKNRRPGQPFFAVFNYTGTHESQIRKRPHEWVHDIDSAPVPAYHPNVREVREDWAQYYDNITKMDGWVAERLKEIEEAGLADDTIVFFYGDHGSGMPRSKRCPYNSGLQVPLIVYIPPKYRHLATPDYGEGAKSERLVAFVDLGPTVISLAGKKPPEYMQGRAFLGKYATPAPKYNFGFRGRMDERTDLMRSVTDGRYVYIRNFRPDLPMGQHVGYMFITPTTRVWKELYDQGKLTPEQAYFWQTPRAPEELYDLQNDPDEVHNLAGEPEFQGVLEGMRRVLRQHILATRDLGFLPENEIHERAGDGAPYSYGHSDKYPLEKILSVAELASSLDPEAVPALIEAMHDDDSAVRYWGALGCRMRGEKAVRQAHDALVDALDDEAKAVRIAAAWALGDYGSKRDLKMALDTLAELIPYGENGPYVSRMALEVVDNLGEKSLPLADVVKAYKHEPGWEDTRVNGYGARLQEWWLERMGLTK